MDFSAKRSILYNGVAIAAILMVSLGYAFYATQSQLTVESNPNPAFVIDEKS